MIEVNFDDLLNNYNSNLLDNLRGFGSKEEYLKFYVPGTSSKKSFYNLIDSFVECKQFDFRISFRNNLFEKKIIDEIIFFLKKISISKITIKENLISLEIKIDINLYQAYRKQIKTKIKNESITEYIKHDINKEIKDKISVYKSKKKIEDLYLKTLFKISSKSFFSKKKLKQKNVFFDEIDNYLVQFVIDNKIITQASHNCDNEEYLKKLLDIFFDICINKNIQEVSDHSVVYLEEKIRIESKATIKKGIILPSHAGTYFDNLNKIMRNIYHMYVTENNVSFGINKHYFKKSYYWINLDNKIKIRKIEEIIEKVLNEYALSKKSVVVQSIDSNFKINLFVDSNFQKLQSKHNILLVLERALKKVEDTLEVFIDEIL